MIVALIQNIAILVALSVVHGLLFRGFRHRGFHLSLLSGLLFGAATIVGMMTPLTWAPGLIFDGRSIVLGTAGLFGGPWAAALAALIAGAYRTYLGGAGMAMGLAVILESALLGVAGHYLRKRWPDLVRPLPLLGLGLLIHAIMLGLVSLLPSPYANTVWRSLSLAILGIYPVGFMVVGLLFVEWERHFQMEDALRENEARQRALLQAIPDLMFTFDRMGRILDCHAPDPQSLYVAPHEFLGRTVDEVLPEPVARLTHERIAEIERTGAPVRYTYTLPMGKAGDRTYESRLVPLPPDHYVAIVRDVTDREQSERALQENQALYENLMTNVLVGIYRLRELPEGSTALGLPKFRYDFFNDRLCELTGLSRAALQDDPESIHRIVHPEDRGEWLSRHQAAMGTREPLSWDGRWVVRGETRWIHVEARPRTMSDGTRVWIGAVLDVTERMQVQAERQEMERRMLHVQKLESLGVLAGGMAHDFNNILMAVLGHADLALAKLPSYAPARDHLDAIITAARQASDLSRQMLAYSGKGRFVIESIQLSDLVAEMAHLLKASISKKALLNLNLEKGLPPIEGDATQIRQILLNLITNASEAIGERSGVITLSTGAMQCGRGYLSHTSVDDDLPEGLYVYVEVSDTGCGMDRETLQRIYEPFFSTKFTGRGLGLAAVLGIVRSHKGAIRVYSEPGKGTTFKVLFPAMLEPAIPKESLPTAATAWSGTGRILLVDDEETLRALGQSMLEHLGFQALVAADGREAVELYRQHRQDLQAVILDLTMPHMDGEEAFREIRQIDPKARVILCSGYTEQDVTARFAGKGLAGFLQKPYTLQTLSDCLRACLAPTS